jgi:hypothetical protein
MENSSWEGRENREPGGKREMQVQARALMREREKRTTGGGEKNRRAEERTRGEGGKEDRSSTPATLIRVRPPGNAGSEEAN